MSTLISKFFNKIPKSQPAPVSAEPISLLDDDDDQPVAPASAASSFSRHSTDIDALFAAAAARSKSVSAPNSSRAAAVASVPAEVSSPLLPTLGLLLSSDCSPASYASASVKFWAQAWAALQTPKPAPRTAAACVPLQHAGSFSQLEAQVISLKHEHADSLLFVEVGYRYRFFGPDAEVAARVLDIMCLADRNLQTASIPTYRLGVHLKRLVHAGFQCGIVTQTETAAVRAADSEVSSKATFGRRVTALYTKATLAAAEALNVEVDSSSSWIMLLTESTSFDRVHMPAAEQDWSTAQRTTYLTVLLVCVADGSLCIERFGDDVSRSRLSTVLVQKSPVELVLPDRLSVETRNTIAAWLRLQNANSIESSLTSTAIDPLATTVAVRVQRYSARSLSVHNAFAELAPFFARCEGSESSISNELSAPQDQVDLTSSQSTIADDESDPPAKRQKLADLQRPTRAPSCSESVHEALQLPESVLICVAALLRHLSSFGVGLERLLTLPGNLQLLAHIARDVVESESGVLPWRSYSQKSAENSDHLQLDASALRALDVLSNSECVSSKSVSSLLDVLNRTSTPFGSRMMKEWVRRPLGRRCDIESRQCAVRALDDAELPWLRSVRELLPKLPDLDRALSRIQYRQCSPAEFCATLRAFQRVIEVVPAAPTQLQSPSKGSCKLAQSTLLQQVLSDAVPAGMSADISYFLNSIQLPANADSDANTGQPEPAQMSAGWQSKFAAWKRGAQTVSTASASTSVFANKCTDGVGGEYVDLFVRPQEYPQLSRLHADIGDCEKTLSDMLAVCRRQMADPALSYMTVSGRTHLLEITPRNYTRVPESWGAAVSVTKKSQRFQPPDIAATVVKQQEFKDRLAIAAKDAWIQFLGAFAERQTRFRACVRALAHLDCLLALQKVSNLPDYVQPEFTDDHVLEMQGGRHPIIEAALGSAYVPTDVELSGDECRAVLLTGPNMSGKSTALRTLACLVIMAQCGACVPALSLRLSVCDAVHVRAGAGDDILGHRSTFMLEMRDAARILNSVTSRSLVILDELGRGTSTHDGAAIADAALQHLLGVKCFTLFATHYPQLGRLANRHLRNVHPAFVADAAGRVIFLYKLVQGICPYSFGLNVATLAGVPDSVVQRAAERAQQMRRVTEGQHWLRNLSDSVSHADAAALRSLCSELKLIIESDHA